MMHFELGQMDVPKPATADGEQADSQQHLVIRETNADAAASQEVDAGQRPESKPIMNDNSGGTGEAYQFREPEKQGIPSHNHLETSPEQASTIDHLV